MEMTKPIDVERDVNIHLEDRAQSRSFFWFIWLLYAVVYMTKNCYNGAMASIVAEGTLTKSQTGLITSMFYLVYTPLQVVGGMVSDRFSPERMIKIGLLVAAIANTVIFFNQSYYVMLGAWMFNAAAQFGIWPSVFKIISAQLVRSERKKMVYLISFSTYGGLILSYIIAAMVEKWQYNFAISAISLLVLALALQLFERKLKPFWKWDAPQSVAAVDADTELWKIPTMKIFRKSAFFFVVVGVIFTILVSQGRSILVPVMFVENYASVTPQTGNLLNILTIIASMVGTLIAGKFLSNVKNEVTATAVVCGIMIPFLAVCRFVGALPIPALMASLCMIAGLESVTTTLRNYYNVQFVKYGKSGTAAGICNAGAAFAFMVSAYFMPKVVEVFGWTVLLTLWPILILISIVLYAFAIRPYRKFKTEGLK